MPKVAVSGATPAPLTVTAGSDCASCSCAWAGAAATASHKGHCNARAALRRAWPAPVFDSFRTAIPLYPLLRIILK
ncbi:hypothetical protein ADE_43710 [Achromobacter denitrificans]|nr:hypothetical protein ADE_43710 [Achromobacter denitrificans]